MSLARQLVQRGYEKELKAKGDAPDQPRIKCAARREVTPSGLRLWISPEHPAARLAGTPENAAMYELHVAEERRPGQLESITGDFEIATACVHS